jgi:DNA-binding transcriptional LysR family regulator
MGVEHPNSSAGPRYDLFSMAIESARAGLGLALVPRLYVLDELSAGTLVIPVDRVVIEDKRYVLVYPQRMHGQWPLNVFIAWLEEEVQRYLAERAARCR